MNEAGRWLLLVHQIPAKPDYLRVKIGRRLAKIGAVQVKKTVYVLPRSEAAREDLEWLRREITDRGGDALVVEAAIAGGMGDADIEERFRAAREQDYVAVTGEARAIGKRLPKRALSEKARAALAVEVQRLEQRLEQIAAIDFFGAPSREPTRALVAALHTRAFPPSPAGEPPASESVRGATWVTRAGVHVDRIASAWLIRRFVDPEARFKFVAPRGYVPEPGELRFDMEDAEHTHEGDRCTFEVLCARFGLDARGLRTIAEMVHDIDLKDGKYERPETDGFGSLVAGIGLVHRDDEERLRLGFEVLDALLAAFARRSSGRAKSRSPNATATRPRASSGPRPSGASRSGQLGR